MVENEVREPRQPKTPTREEKAARANVARREKLVQDAYRSIASAAALGRTAPDRRANMNAIIRAQLAIVDPGAAG